MKPMFLPDLEQGLQPGRYSDAIQKMRAHGAE